MIGFDNGNETTRELDGQIVSKINADLTSSVNLTQAKKLAENAEISYSGMKKGGAFDITSELAQEFMNAKGNPNKRPNSDVVKPWVNGQSLVGTPQDKWIIDFGASTSSEEASLYEKPFEYLKKEVYPEKSKNNRATRRENWWIHSEPAPALRKAVFNLKRYIATPRVSKHRIFVCANRQCMLNHQNRDRTASASCM